VGTQRCTQSIGVVVEYGVTPPHLNGVNSDRSVLGVLKNEEDQNGRNGNTRVHRSGQNVVVLCPPGEVTTADDVLEDESNDTPCNVVDSVGGRNVTSAREDDGEVEVTNPALRVLLGQEPSNDGADEAKEEEEGQSVVNLSLGELTSRTNDTPDDGRGTEHLG